MSTDTLPAAAATSTGTDELTDEQFQLADRIDLVLENAGNGLTISAIAKRARGDYHDVADVLAYLLKHEYAHTSGNGSWAHYHRGRAR